MMFAALYLVTVLTLLASYSAEGSFSPVVCGSYLSYNVTTDENGLYHPQFVRLNRCQGGIDHTDNTIIARQSTMKCVRVPSAQDDVNITVRHVRTNVTRVVRLTNETKCKSVCIAHNLSCTGYWKWNERRCRCDCAIITPKLVQEMENQCRESNRQWDQQKCGCQCHHESKCSRLQEWDNTTCICRDKLYKLPDTKMPNSDTDGKVTISTLMVCQFAQFFVMSAIVYVLYYFCIKRKAAIVSTRAGKRTQFASDEEQALPISMAI